MQALLIGPEEKQKIQAVLDYAERNIIDHKLLMRMANGTLPPVGDNPNFACAIPKDHRVVFSYEIHKGRKARHISVSVANKTLPHPQAVNLILKEFGFNEVIDTQKTDATATMLSIWPEGNSINVVEFVDDESPADGPVAS
jgi:hypothetical protein